MDGGNVGIGWVLTELLLLFRGTGEDARRSAEFKYCVCVPAQNNKLIVAHDTSITKPSWTHINSLLSVRASGPHFNFLLCCWVGITLISDLGLWWP